jgi:Leucine-rich repeat (LRR) protein
MVRDITKRVFMNLQSLKELNLEDAYIKNIQPGSFDDLSQLEILNLFENELQNLDDDLFIKMVNLKKLDISSNKITNFNPIRMLNSNDLEELMIGKNRFKIENMGSLFINFSKLQVLNISYLNLNKLTKEMFAGMDNLKVLQAYCNKFSTIDCDFLEYLVNLEVLNFASNKSLNSLAVKFFNKLKELNLCDCGLTHIYEDMFSNLS